MTGHSTTPLGKRAYGFGGGAAEGDPADVARFGLKGAALFEMSRMGLPVPPGFVIDAAVGHELSDGPLPTEVKDELRAAVARVEALTGLGFGDPERPLLLSVRSGARISMPGLMGTVLNLGMDAPVFAAMRARDLRFALDCRRRFLSSYGRVVLGIGAGADGPSPFEAARYAAQRIGAEELADDALPGLIEEYERVFERARASLPDDPWEQLFAASAAVFRSWRNPACAAYRDRHGIPEEWGTAVSVCAMVYGNASDDSATGVAFTHDPNTGERRFGGEFLPRVQGEDVVSGTRIPRPLADLERAQPAVYAALEKAARRLEDHYRDSLDIEFTVERGVLWLLQVRAAKPSPEAAVRIAVSQVDEGLFTPREAVRRIAPAQLEHLSGARLDPSRPGELLTKGLPASPGVASGPVVFTAEAALRTPGAIMVRVDTSAADVPGRQAAAGVLTSTGGLTCHAAIVARAMGRACIVGASELRVDVAAGAFTARGRRVSAGDRLTIDGSTGAVLLGEAAATSTGTSRELERFLAWVDDIAGGGDRAAPPPARLAAAQRAIEELV